MDGTSEQKRGTGLLITGGVILLAIAGVVIANRIRAKKIYNDLNTLLDADPNSAAAQQGKATAAAATAKIVNAQTQKAFDTNYFKTQGAGVYGTFLLDKNSKPVLSTATFGQMADNIYNSHNFIMPDTPNVVVSEFALLPSLVAASYLSLVFLQKYGQGLEDFLVQHFSDNLGTINLQLSKLS